MSATPIPSQWWESIPDHLKNVDQWTCWKFAERDGKTTKEPCDVNGITHDVAKNPAPLSFANALAACIENRCGTIEGVGFIFTKEDSFAGIDLDKCILDGKLSPEAEAIISNFNTYAEMSPSGTGVKIFLRGKLPGKRRRKRHVEMYDDGRYFTTTGRVLPGKPKTVNDCQAALDDFYRKTFGEESQAGEASAETAPPEERLKPYLQLTDEELLEAIRLRERSFNELWQGVREINDSEGDFALCSILIRYTGRDLDRTERLMRQSARLRPKFDERRGTQTYLQRTIANANARITNSELWIPGASNAVTETRPEVRETLELFNERFYVVESLGGKCRVCSEEPDANLSTSFKFAHQSFQDFKNRFSHQRVKTGEGTFQGRGTVWLGHKDRRQYTQVVYAPEVKLPDNIRNLWRGFAYEPKKGDCSLYLAHLRDNICQGIQERYDWLIGWMAYSVRHPNEPGHTAPVFIGGQGIGKNSCAEHFGHLWGSHFMVVTQKSQFTGHFNAHLRAMSVLVVNEAFFAGDRSQAGPMKGLITDEFLSVEAKGVDIERARNLLHVIICSNEDWVVPADMDSRRFTVFRVGDAHKEDTGYFRKLHEQMANGGYSALLYHLRHEVDLTDFDPRKILLTEELNDQKAHSLYGVESVWYECLQRGCLPGKIEEDKTAILRASDLVDWAAKKHRRGWDSLKTEYVGYLFGINPRGKNKGMGFEKSQLLDVFDEGRVRVWKIPTLAEARDAWAKNRFAADWGDEVGEWKIDKDWSDEQYARQWGSKKDGGGKSSKKERKGES
jgi:hypothetical protein